MDGLLSQFGHRLSKTESPEQFAAQYFDDLYYVVIHEMARHAWKGLALGMVGQVENACFDHDPGGSCRLRGFWLNSHLLYCTSQRRLINGQDHLAAYAAIGLGVSLWRLYRQATYDQAWQEVVGQEDWGS